MKKLIIKKPGYFIHIPGTQSCRTPVVIDITKVNQKLVEAELRRNGITKYEIVIDDKPIINNNIDVKNTDKKINNDLLTFLQNQQKTIENIENLLHTIINTNQNKNEQLSQKDIELLLKSFAEAGTIEGGKTTKKKSKVNEEFDDFIPEINIDNLKIKGSSSSDKVIKSKTNLKNAENLKEFKKKELK